jgi:hypothetical protein
MEEAEHDVGQAVTCNFMTPQCIAAFVLLSVTAAHSEPKPIDSSAPKLTPPYRLIDGYKDLAFLTTSSWTAKPSKPRASKQRPKSSRY